MNHKEKIPAKAPYHRKISINATDLIKMFDKGQESDHEWTGLTVDNQEFNTAGHHGYYTYTVDLHAIKSEFNLNRIDKSQYKEQLRNIGSVVCEAHKNSLYSGSSIRVKIVIN